MGLFSAIGGLFGIGGNRKAISDANKADQAGIAQAQSTISGQQTANTNAFSPYTTAGAGATNSIADLLGLSGNESQSQAITNLQNTPTYQALFDQGNRTVLQDAAATGGVRGGNTTNSLAQFGSGLLSNTIQQQLANLMGVSNQGQGAASNLAGLNSNLSGGIASLFNQSGQDNASAILGKHAAINQGVSGLTNWLDASSSGTGGGSNGSQLISQLASLF